MRLPPNYPQRVDIISQFTALGGDFDDFAELRQNLFDRLLDLKTLIIVQEDQRASCFGRMRLQPSHLRGVDIINQFYVVGSHGDFDNFAHVPQNLFHRLLDRKYFTIAHDDLRLRFKRKRVPINHLRRVDIIDVFSAGTATWKGEFDDFAHALAPFVVSHSTLA